MDNDCDGFIDEGSGPDAPEDAITFYADLDGDGLSDLIMGAHNVEIDGENNSGRINVFFGANLPTSGEVFRSQADVEIVGSAGENFGHGLVSNGDINGDGL